MRTYFSIIVAVLFAFSLAACSGGKAPAEQAIKAAEEAFNAAKGEAVKYVPDQVKAVEDALNAAKDSFTMKDYAAATSAATSVAGKAKELASGGAAKKAELTAPARDARSTLATAVQKVNAKNRPERERLDLYFASAVLYSFRVTCRTRRATCRAHGSEEASHANPSRHCGWFDYDHWIGIHRAGGPALSNDPRFGQRRVHRRRDRATSYGRRDQP